MTRKFSSEITQLADQHGLGTPVKRHSHLGWIIFWACVLGMCLLAAIAFPLSMSSSSNPPPLVLGTCLELIFLFGVFISVALIIMYLPYSAYECSEGFIELSKKKGKLEVKQFLRWDDVSNAYMVASRAGGSYYVIDRRGHKINIDSRAIWRKCKRIAKQHAAIGM
jgi:hypothetical protein